MYAIRSYATAHLHHKFAVFDRARLLTGSFNWTRAATRGVIAGKYDEYFFRQEDAGNDPARILESAAALAFVQQVDPTATGPVVDGQFYRGEINGEEYLRVYYQNPEIHPQNVFSTKTAADVVDFFYESLGVPDGHAVIASSNQTWVWKQAFNCLGLIGILRNNFV